MSIKFKKFYFPNQKTPVPIYSVSISSCGQFIATGRGDHFVDVWDAAELEKAADCPDLKPLKTFKHHTGAVNAVRWSPDRLAPRLASGSDDHTVAILQRAGGGWKLRCSLLGHCADVTDVAWAPPPEPLLASCSVDNTVIVWDAQKKSRRKRLRGHRDWVLGVEWSPDGRHLVSQSKNGVVLVHETRGWTRIALRERFEEITLTSLEDKAREGVAFSRMGFSPKGALLGCAKGFDTVHTAPVFRMGAAASHAFSFVGHHASTTVLKFSPALLFSGERAYTLCAVGSADRTVTVWRSDACRPLFVLKNFFALGVVDISWKQSGLAFWACSVDGTAALIDLGAALAPGLTAVFQRDDARFRDWAGDGHFATINPNAVDPSEGSAEAAIAAPKEAAGVFNKERWPDFGHAAMLAHFNEHVLGIKTEKTGDGEKLSKERSFGSKEGGFAVSVEVLSGASECLVTVRSPRKSAWRLPVCASSVFVSRRAVLVTAGERLFLFDFAGRPLCPALLLPFRVVCAVCSGRFVLALGADRNARLWGRAENSGGFRSLLNVLLPSAVQLTEVEGVAVSKKGATLVLRLQGGKRCVYCKDLEAWLELDSGSETGAGVDEDLAVSLRMMKHHYLKNHELVRRLGRKKIEQLNARRNRKRRRDFENYLCEWLGGVPESQDESYGSIETDF